MLKRALIGAGAVLLTLGLVAACAPVQLLNGITPSRSFNLEKNLSYGELDRHKLDIYRAETPKAGAPVLVFIHGGGWDSGSKDIYKFLAEGFTLEGYDVVVPNYRLYPEARYPDFLEDSAKAVAFTARQFEGRPLVLMGHSAGAYNVLMLGLNGDYLLENMTDVCQTVSGIVSLAGPVGIVPLESDPLITIFPDRFTKEDAPLNHADNLVPALLLINGDEDKSVYPQNAQALGEKVSERGGKADVKIYEGLDHIDVVRLLSRHFDGDSSLKSDILAFIGRLPKEADNYCR